jgi:hypothetical protein
LVPNLINVITPNGDGINDFIDYSALAGKQNLVLIFSTDTVHRFIKPTSLINIMDGTINGRKYLQTTGIPYHGMKMTRKILL